MLDTVEGIRRIPAGQWRGAARLPGRDEPDRRPSLEVSDRQAAAVAAAITETESVAPEIARLRGIALAGVFQIIITEAGRRTRQGQSQDQIAAELLASHRSGPRRPRPLAHPRDEMSGEPAGEHLADPDQPVTPVQPSLPAATMRRLGEPGYRSSARNRLGGGGMMRLPAGCPAVARAGEMMAACRRRMTSR